MSDPRAGRSPSVAEGVLEPPTVVDGLKRLYNSKIKPLEATYNYEYFHSPLLNNSDFDAKPMILLLGQYSVGKTSFIRYLLGRDFPGQRIGPEPTTDRFVAIMNGPIDRTIPGNALCVQDDMPFKGLTKFGTSFLNRMEASMLPAEILEKVTLIDTPGVLSGAKQRMGRSYDFVEVVEWFAERCDMILMLFDAHKLDISDEFKRTIECLRGHDDKVRVILNKADRVSNQQLMRVYGALMWSLGKVTLTPEVLRVYIGSFWDEEYHMKENQKLFDAERADLLNDIRSLPRNAAVRKVNELVKRARLAKVHAYIISYLRAEMPSFFGKESKQRELIDNLSKVFYELHKKHHLPVGDFPPIDHMREMLRHCDFKKFPKLNQRQIDAMDEVLGRDIPILMKQLGQEHFVSGLAEGKDDEDEEKFDADLGAASGGVDLGHPGAGAGSGTAPPAMSEQEARDKLTAFYTKFNPAKLYAVDQILNEYRGRYRVLFKSLEDRYGSAPPLPAPRVEPSAPPKPVPRRRAAPAPTPTPATKTPEPEPSNQKEAEGDNPFDESSDEEEAPVWQLESMRAEISETFEGHGPVDGKLSGKACKGILLGTGLQKRQLKKVWVLSDMDKDGSLDLDEFCVAMYLVDLVQGGSDLPEELDISVVPPSKR